MEKSIKIKISIEPWDEGEYEDPDGIETDITLYEEDIKKCCEYAGLDQDGKVNSDTLREFVYEKIDDIIEIDGIAPSEYNNNYSWDFATFDDVRKFDEFVEPIVEEYETESRKERLENFVDGMEFVETKVIDGIEYAYYRVPTEDVY